MAKKFLLNQLIILLVTLGGLATACMGQPATSLRISDDKKLIKVGHDSPDTFQLRQRVSELEKLGLDGVVIVPKIKSEHGLARGMWVWFTKYPLEISHVQHIIDNLKATTFHRFTDNFLWAGTHAGSLKWDDDTTEKMPVAGWFDDDFDMAVKNMALAARVAKEGGLKGIFFDMENYGGGTWDEWMYSFSYPEASMQPKLMTHSYEKCAEQVRLRGKQIMAAMCREYPDITLILIPGAHQFAGQRIGNGTRTNPLLTKKDGLASSDYGLLAPFVDGLLEGSTPSATIIDGTENSYAWTYSKQFEKSRKDFTLAVQYSAVPQLYQSRLKLGFGMMLDYDGVRPWTTKAPYYTNHFTPGETKLALHNAMHAGDGYTWIWSEQAFMMPYCGHKNRDANVPKEYIDAIASVHEPIALTVKRDARGALTAPLPPKASTEPGYSEQETFGPLLDKYEYIMDLPTRWRFFVDEEDMNLLLHRNKEDWEADSQWVEIGDYFENQGHRFKGAAYYRCEFKIPVELKGQRLFLHFGGIAGNQVYLYFNGPWIPDQSGNTTGAKGSLPNGVWGWELTKRARYGETNVVIVSSRNTTSNSGGIYKPYVKLGVLKEKK